MSNPETISGYIEHFVYRSADTGYGVANLVLTKSFGEDHEEGDELTVVGQMRELKEGDTIEATGNVTLHPIYGEQFNIRTWRIVMPSDSLSIERYLASGAIKGIRQTLAHSIVKKFGEDTIRVMEEEPERLADIKGISLRMARNIGIQMNERRQQRDTAMFLQQVGISGTTASRVIKRYGDSVKSVIKENPYRLAEEIDGVGFKTADDIARRLGIRADAEFRVESGLMYALTQGAMEGHSFLPAGLLFERTKRLLGLNDSPDTEELIESMLSGLNVSSKVVIKNIVVNERSERAVYTSRFYHEEQAIAGMLGALMSGVDGGEAVGDEDIDTVEKIMEIKLDEVQREAVKKSLSDGVLILTGGPGTGKTTTMGAMLKLFEDKGLSVVLAAPTGRAAKRMAEATGYEARTIHRLLEVAGGPRDDDRETEVMRRAVFNRNEDNPLEADIVVIDEMSMVDMHLFYSLLKAITPGAHLILTGDAAQLPSVGPGQVLKDLIESGRFPVVMLKRIFRQAAKSDIVMNAHRINDGEMPVMDNNSADFFFLSRDRYDVILKNLVLLIRDKLPSYIGAPAGEIQVLTPMRKGPLGAQRLNEMLQSQLNPPAGGKAEWVQGERIWREGDKVMQTKNNYSAEWEIRGYNGIVIERGDGIFNGDLGVIKSIDKISEEITVMFDEKREVRVPFQDMDEMDLAYAATIHKSQGSEYPAVLLPLLGGPKMLLNRNLLYTAVTRAKSCVVILGSRGTVEEMVGNMAEMERFTGLKRRISELP